MAWIESHQSLSRHRKTLHMVAALKVDRHKLLGHLQELWWWGLDNADVNGHVGQVSQEVLAEAAGWPIKDATRWVTALLEAGGDRSSGFLELDVSGYVLHDWYDYAGKFNDQRIRNRARMQTARAANKPGTDDARAVNVQDTSGARALNGSDLCGATGPDRTGPTGPDLPALTSPKSSPVEGRTLAQTTALFDGLEVPDEATAAHDMVVRRLEQAGFAVQRELAVTDRSHGGGRVDVFAQRDDGDLAIEIDRRTPRQKSITKLRQVDAERVILLRLPPGERPGSSIRGITVLGLACPDAIGTSTPRPQRTTTNGVEFDTGDDAPKFVQRPGPNGKREWVEVSSSE